MPPLKLHPFRGELRTVPEIAAALGIKRMSVYGRLHAGIDLSAPKRDNQPRLSLVDPPMHDDGVRYDRDIECRVARIACGGTCDQEQIARLWDVSRQRIEQVERSAIAKLRAQAEWCSDAKAMVDELSRLRKQTYVERAEQFTPGIAYGDSVMIRKLTAGMARAIRHVPRNQKKAAE